MKKIFSIVIFLFAGMIVFAQTTNNTPPPPPPPPPFPHMEQGANGDSSLVFSFAEEMPTFPGPDSAFQKYLASNIKYPKSAKDAGKQGTVFINFIVEEDGSITNVHAVKEVPGAPELTAESIRVISQMPNWIPGKMKGKNVRVQITQPVKFVLDNSPTKTVIPMGVVKPTFVGGDSALTDYINKNLVYPKMSRKAPKEGSVVISFIVETDGSITYPTVVTEVPGAPEFTTEALRLVSAMPKWKPGTINARMARQEVKVTIDFKKPKKK